MSSHELQSALMLMVEFSNIYYKLYQLCHLNNKYRYLKQYHVVGPCHHGMARPQVADRGTASDKEGSCE